MALDGTQPKYWNIWWTLTVIVAGLTIVAGVLEALGVWHDVGVGIGIIGLVLTVVGSTTAATRTAVVGLDRRLDQMHDTLKHILRVLDRRLPDRP